MLILVGPGRFWAGLRWLLGRSGFGKFGFGAREIGSLWNEFRSPFHHLFHSTLGILFCEILVVAEYDRGGHSFSLQFL